MSTVSVFQHGMSLNGGRYFQRGLSLEPDVWSIIQDIVIDMNEARLNTVGQLAAFLEGTLEVHFRSLGNDGERYAFIGSVVARFAYRRLRRAD